MPTSKKALVLAVVLLAANVVKSASASLVERNSAVIIALKTVVAVGIVAVIIALKVAVAVGIATERIATKTSVAMISAATTIARESDATTEVVISEAAAIVVLAVVMTVLLLIRIVHAHVAGTVDQEVKIEVVLAENQQENEIRSTKLSCILGV